MPGPVQTCLTCGRVVEVNVYARGFPPDTAKRKLIKLCKADGHTADPQYTAGFDPSLAHLIRRPAP